ncbi:MAG: sodium:proton antiporter [Pseudomonadales bacterium]|nr:sodium:proton antiporter [Pseudomonadales bacterium]
MSIISVLEIVLLMGLIGLVAAVLARFTRLPLTILLIVIAFVFFEIVTRAGFDTGVRATNFQSLVFYILLPILIFEAAYNIDQQQLLKSLIPILLLAIFGLLISTSVTAVLVYYGIGSPQGFPVIAALITGVLLAATDPVAVVSQLKALHAPVELEVLIEGESLFNDATAIVLFSILLAVATSGGAGDGTEAGATRIMAAVILFAKTFFGGGIIGLAVAVVAVGLSKLLPTFNAVGLITLVTAYGCFYIAEHIFHVSGVMSVLMSGLVLGKFHQKYAAPDVRLALSNLWQLAAYIFNMLVFVLMGLVITIGMFTERWLAMLIAIGAVLIARVISVYLSTGVSRFIFFMPVPENYKPVMVWGGLRGVVTVALVFSLPHELPYWWTIQSMAFGVVLFTLFIQAPTNHWLLKKLKVI